jgi:SAM-dependent methyltransferase
MLPSYVRKLVYRCSWDTRCRGVDTLKILHGMVTPDTKILDAGCGEYGLAAFMPRAQITGLDLLREQDVKVPIKYVRGSLVDLPFDKESFDISVSVDVLEHLPEAARSEAISQLVKVSKRAVVVTFPLGDAARMIDEEFKAKLDQKKQPVPEWLEEHLSHRYPDHADVIETIDAEARKRGQSTLTRIYYSENLGIARLLRNSNVHSRYMYLALNLFTGIFKRLMPGGYEGCAYRVIVVSEFQND